MKFNYDPSQEHQLRAIAALARLFVGQSRRQANARVLTGGDGLFPSIPVVDNGIDLTDDDILRNLRAAQNLHNETAESQIDPDTRLQKIVERFDDNPTNGLVAGREVEFPNFSVEMETGTGKTYVFLRAMRELAREFGFLKFIVVAPSIAVRENILHTLAATDSHLSAQCGQQCEWAKYDSGNLFRVRDFASSGAMQVLVMTIASFNRELNVIRRDADVLSGDTPLRLIQATRPILILDEPQNMESDLSLESLARLNPLFALRFSATHRASYNLAYRLSPADAYKRGLVKHLRVAAVQAENPDAPVARLEGVTRRSNGVLTARIALNVHKKDGSIAEDVKLFKLYERLIDKSGLPEYDRISIDDIAINPVFVRLSNGRELREGEDIGGLSADVLRGQIDATIMEHFRRQSRLRDKGVKVLSLFFIDRVEKYQAEDGEIRRMFEARFDALKESKPEWAEIPAREVHTGYFAESKKGDSERDVKAYDLVMRDKESLLAFAAAGDEEHDFRKRRVAFIFSHSALREGWDNPNIMQICVLRVGGRSTMRRRQEVGRGLRLAVNQKGERTTDEDANTLTVIAAESYADFARGYQMEIIEDCRALIEAKMGKSIEDLTEEERAHNFDIYGAGILPPPPNLAETQTARATRLIRNRDGGKEFSPEFRELWERVSQKTAYCVRFNEAGLIEKVVAGLQNESVVAPRVGYTLAQIEVNDENAFFAVQASGTRTIASISRRRPLPSIVSLVLRLLQNDAPKIILTRRTVLEIFRRAGAQNALNNPTGWAAAAARVIREEMADLLVDGVEYRKIDNQFYDWEQHFAREEREITAALVADLRDLQKTPYDLIGCDASTEKAFADGLAAREDVKLFFKLPRDFRVPTPVGNYNPDWAVLLTDENGRDRLYFVAETKGAVGADGSVRWGDLRGNEGRKIKCAARHFGSTQFNKEGALSGIDYQVVKTHNQLRRRD